MDYIYWWEENMESGLKELHNEFLNYFNRAEYIPAIYNPILYDYVNENNMKHWDRELLKYGNQKLTAIKQSLGETQLKDILLQNLDLFAAALDGVKSISKRIELMNNFKGSMELKASLFLINIFNDLLNGPYSKILQLYIKLQSQIEEKVLDQKTLRQQMECLSSRNYNEILNIADANIRNAMSHDGVEIRQNDIYFTYRNGKETITEKQNIYDVMYKTTSLYDGINGLLLSFIKYLVENIVTYDDVYSNERVNSKVKSFFEKLSMSTLEIECTSVEEIELRKEHCKQVNVVLNYSNLNLPERFFIGINTAGRVYGLRSLTIKDKVMINFESDKAIKSFIRVSGDVLEKFNAGEINEEHVVKTIKETQDYMMFPVNNEERNKYEDLFRYYPDIVKEDFTIREIEDISIKDLKRFRAVVYPKSTLNRKHIEKIVFKAINELKQLQNYGFTDHLVKYGDMEADVLYLIVYKKEVRKNELRALVPSNNNFLVQIQYDINKQFNIKNPLIDSQLLKFRNNKIEYNWNPRFYRYS